MKIGFRTPSFKKSFKARTTGRVKRSIKRSVNPAYGKRGMGWINNPKKAAYNKVYNRTTKSVFSACTGRSGKVNEANEVTGLNEELKEELKELLQTVKDAPAKLSRSIDELNDESCKIIRNKVLKVFAVLAVIFNPYLLLIVAPAYGIYRLCRKNRKAPVNKHKSNYSIK